MQLRKKPDTDTILLIGILLVGSFLRFYNYHILPLSYDEFSALLRTRYDNFYDLIRFGVVKTDTHPAGIQIFMNYWVKVFGEKEWIVKLPFVLMGVASIYLVFKIGKAWFNSSVGLGTAMFVAFLQYPITYSQFARPYASGMFFTLLLVWVFHKSFLSRSTHQKRYILAYVIAGTACAYNHHFTLFFLGLAGISGLLIVPWKKMVTFIVANLIIVFLYLPHIGIFLQQLNKGGVESWLKKPSVAFFTEYLQYILHFNIFLYITAALLILFSFVYIKKTLLKGNRYRLMMLFWILATYFTAYYYSIYRNSVLQYSVLIFTFPFLIMLVLSFMGKLKPVLKYVVVILFGAVAIYSLIVDRQHYRVQYQSVLEQTMAETAAAREKYGESQVLAATNISEKVQHYYSDRYMLDPGTIITIDTTPDYVSLRKKLKSFEGEYLAIGWVNIPNLEFFAVAKEFFPVTVEKKLYYTGDFYLLSRNRNLRDTILVDDRVERVRFDSLTLYDNAMANMDTMLFDHKRLRMPGWLGFAKFYDGPLKPLVEDHGNYMLMSIEVENPQPDYESIMICEFIRNEEIIHYVARPFRFYTRSDWGRFKIHIAVKLMDLDLNYAEDRVRVYLSNVDEEYYYINYFTLEVTKGNPYLYSLFEKIPEKITD